MTQPKKRTIFLLPWIKRTSSQMKTRKNFQTDSSSSESKTEAVFNKGGGNMKFINPKIYIAGGNIESPSTSGTNRTRPEQEAEKDSPSFLNGVWLQTDSAKIVSIFFKDAEALKAGNTSLNNHHKSFSLPGQIFANVGDSVQMRIDFQHPPDMQIEPDKERLKITNKLRSRIWHQVYFKLNNPGLDNLHLGQPCKASYEAEVFTCEGKTTGERFSDDLNFSWPMTSNHREKTDDCQARPGNDCQQNTDTYDQIYRRPTDIASLHRCAGEQCEKYFTGIKTTLVQTCNQKAWKVGVGGDTLELGGCKIDVKPGAGGETTKVKIFLHNDQSHSPDSAVPVSHIFKCKVSKFEAPIRVRLRVRLISCLVPKPGKQLRIKIMSKTGEADWRQIQEVTLGHGNEIEYSVSHFCWHVAVVSEEDEKNGEYHLFNDVWMHLPTGMILSLFWKDDFSLREGSKKLEVDHKRIISLPGIVIASIGDTIAVEIECPGHPEMKIMSVDGSNGRIEIGSEMRKNNFFAMLFRPHPHLDNLKAANQFEVLYRANVFDCEGQPTDGGFSVPLHVTHSLLRTIGCSPVRTEQEERNDDKSSTSYQPEVMKQTLCAIGASSLKKVDPNEGEAQGADMSSEDLNTIKFVVYLCNDFGLEEKEAKEVAEELQDKLEIFSPDELKLVKISELEHNLTTLMSVEKEKFLDHVKKIQQGSQVKRIDNLLVDFSKPLRDNCKVYKGKKTYPGVDDIPVAVKILDIMKGGGDKWPEQFRQEIYSMLTLHHNHIVQFMACGELKQSSGPKAIYIATRLCHDKTLYDINVSALDQQQRINIILQIGDALRFIHSKNIAHRDLKPQNILFTEDGKRVVVCDFGISKNVEIDPAEGTITRSEIFKGSLGWTPSEVCHGDKELDFFKADIFSFGLLSHFVICAKIHAFSDSNKPNLAGRKSSNTAPQHSVRVSDVSPKQELSKVPPAQLYMYIWGKYEPAFTALRKINDGCLAIDLFQKMLSHDPKKRPTIEEVLQHYVFWDCYKKVQFFKDMYTSFIDRKKFKLDVTGTDEQISAFTCLGPRSTAQGDDGNSAIGASPPSGDTCNLSSPGVQNFKSPFTDKAFSSSSSNEEDDRKSKNVLEEMLEVIGPDWLSKITSDKEYLPSGKIKPDEKKYENTLAELIRYIRNYHEHRFKQEDEKNKSELAWKFFSRLFPKLLPYVFTIMEPSFSDGHKATAKYKKCVAKIEEVDLSHVL